MAGSLNKVMLIGNLGRDPEVRRLNSGEPVVNFSVATSETWRDKASGERKERTEWHNIVIFNENLAKVAEQYLKKGTKVYIEGQLQTREFQDKDGNQRKTTEIVLQRYRGELTILTGRGEQGGGDDEYGGGRVSSGGGSDFGRSGPSERRREPARAGSGSSGGGRRSDMDDDIPF